MISSVEIASFRGVRKGKVDKLSPLSILVGPNNSGKSTCLEAIACVGLGSSANNIANLLLRRGGPSFNALQYVFANNTTQTEITVHGQKNENDVTWKTLLSFGETPDINLANFIQQEGLDKLFIILTVRWQHSDRKGKSKTFIDQNRKISSCIMEGGKAEAFGLTLVDVNAVREVGALENAYSELEKAGQVNRVVQALSGSMTGLVDLRILKVDQTFVLHAVMQNPPPLPVFAAGDGFKRFLEVASAMVGYESDVVLLEEPESYQHPRYMRELATLMLLSVRAGVQIILSTHSIELIDCLLSAPEAAGLVYPSVHRLRLVNGELSAVALDRESALSARQDLFEDLRA